MTLLARINQAGGLRAVLWEEEPVGQLDDVDAFNEQAKRWREITELRELIHAAIAGRSPSPPPPG